MIPDRVRPIIERVQPLADAFDEAGHTLYLVGGVVRDLLLGEFDPNDIDLTTDADPDTIERIVKIVDGVTAMWAQGKRFGTIGATVGGINHEIITHRAEAYNPDSRKPEVAFSTDIEADLSRRDFTINAMALSLTDPDGPQLIDPFDGMADLAQKRLRTPLSPQESFSDDPLRMLRAARFLTRFDLKADEALLDAVAEMADRLTIVSAERIQSELNRMVVLPDPSPALWFLHDTGLAAHFFPELATMRLEQDPIHRHKDVLAHTIAVVKKTSPDLELRLGALFHDIGKPRTRAIGPNGVSFHHHEVVGARMTRTRMKELKYSKELIDNVSQLVFLHLRFHGYDDGLWTDSAVRRYVRDAGPLLGKLNELTRCDCTTRNKRKAEMLSRRMDNLEARIAALEEEEAVSKIRPELDGTAVMAILEIGPGREVGQAMKWLLDLRLDEGVLGTDEVEARLRAWWADQT